MAQDEQNHERAGFPAVADVRADFDRLACLADEGWDHNRHYHSYLLRSLPNHCEQALEIGCGTGCFSRHLALRAEHVLGLDLSPQMVRVAREQSSDHPNIEFRVTDIWNWDFPAERYDIIASIATLHHLPLEPMLIRMEAALRPGGMLVVLDLYRLDSLADRLLHILAMPVSVAWRLLKCGKLRSSRKSRDAWAAHGERDTYLSLREIRQAARRLLPGALVRRHLLWRYSLIWQKPAFDHTHMPRSGDR